MSLVLAVFEDARWRDLRPLTDAVPVPALAFGGSSLAERIARAARLPLASLVARADALTLCRTLPAATGVPDGAREGGVVVNAAALPGPWLESLVAGGTPELVRRGERLVGARLAGDALPKALARATAIEQHLAGLGLPERQVDTRLIEWPWQLIEWNAEAIASDLAGEAAEMAGELHASAVTLGDGRVAIAAGARVDAYAVLDARGGPIALRRGAVVGAHTVVVGPCVVGEASQLLGGVVAHSTIGRQCRIAGEVEECIWQGFANKRHHGFVGHSAIGEWVNLGALTTTSDLKNNYGTVRVRMEDREVDTGATKVGSMIGAHVKTGIGTLLPTGGMLGTGSNLFGGGRFAPKAVPSFGWWDGEGMVEHRLEAFLETAAIALSRRGERLGPADEAALRRLFEACAGERAGVR